MSETDVKATADTAVPVAKKQIEAGLLYRNPRFQKIRDLEDVYFRKDRPALKGRWNIPFDTLIMRAYVRTLMSKIDEPVKLEFKSTTNPKAAKKVSAAWEKESAPSTGKWDMKDRLAKKLGILSGRAIFLKYAESDPKYKDCLDVVDHWDFVTEPNGGVFLDNHLFHYQRNIFKTDRQLTEGAAAGYYDRAQVMKLLTGVDDKEVKETTQQSEMKDSRFAGLGLDQRTNNYVGQKLFNLTQGVMTFKGTRWWIVFDERSQIWIRFKPLKQVFESDLTPYTSYAVDDEAFLYWSLGSADDVAPTAEAMRVTLNEGISNLQRRNWDMTAFNANKVKDPSQLIYRPDGLIDLDLKDGETAQNAIFKMVTPDNTNIVVNLVEFLNNFLGEKGGVTPGNQGQGSEDKVGIYFGNIQQAADRYGLLNKSYAQAQVELGQRFDWGLFEHAPENYMVQIIGATGASWEKLTKDEKNLDYDVVPVSANAEAQQNEMKAKKRLDALTAIITNPTLVTALNPKVTVEEILRVGEYDDEAIERFLDTQNYGNEEVLAEAGMAIQLILEGKQPRICLDATSGFVQKVLNFAKSNDIKQDIFDKLMAYANAHMQIAAENAGRAAVLNGFVPLGPQPKDPNAPRQMPTNGAPPTGAPPTAPPGSSPLPSSPVAPGPLTPNGPPGAA